MNWVGLECWTLSWFNFIALPRGTRSLLLVRYVVLCGGPFPGGIKPGCFKIGNTGGMMDNLLLSKLYRPGRSVRVTTSLNVH